MSLLKVNPTQRKILAIVTIFALLAGVWFLRHYIMLILFSALVVILFNPVYRRQIAKGRNPQKAALYTMLISALAVIIPVALVSVITFFQIERLVNTITSGSYPHDLTQLANNIIDGINRFLANIGVSYHLSVDSIAKTVSTAAQNFGKALVGGILSSVSGFFGFITTAIIYIYVFMSMITHQDKILDTLKATVRGQFIIALCQGTVSAIGLAIAGFGNLFFFFWMLLTVMSVIPLGAGIVTIPIGIALILTGHYWQGVLVILNHLVLVTNIDNVMRPKLVPRHARLDAALMILAVFAGLGMFGFFGIVLGPVLMIIIVTTIQMYLEVFTETKSIEQSADVASKSGLLKRVQFWKRA
jgi:predicted PurR-regulated permease PerM